MAEWISVKDRLPEGYVDVLVYDDHDDRFWVGWYQNDYDRWCTDECGKLYGVTHWMPLPEPPKGE